MSSAPAADATTGRPARFASRYSRFVDMMRFGLPATALVLIALVVLWPQVMGGYGSMIVPMLMRGSGDGSDAMRMRLPRYVGQTDQAEPYAVAAESALVDPEQPNRIHLENLEAELVRQGQSDLHLTALAGIYYRAIEKLHLEGGIELTTSDGYRFSTESAKVSLAQVRVTGDQPVRGKGPAGTLEAERFEIRRGGEVLRFEGRVRVTVQPGAGDGASS
jgi:lipopolysaccharide export system protein LptC